MTRNPALDALMADYELGTEIGHGSFGVVWAARHRQLGRQVAVKELKAVDEADRARFRREARLLAGLRHPHVVTVHDFREAGDVRALVMEALTGGTLEDRGRSLSVEDVIVVGLAAASALHHVHRNGLLHRDLKPANVMFDAEGVVRVTDFGVAGGPASTLDRTAADQTMAGTLVGTPSFASPEQCGVALGAAWPSPSAASDQYALAATLYASLTGDVPHDTSGGILALCNRKMTQAARPVSQLRPGLPTAIALVLDRAL
ncbi:MAG: serine/threonine protein kinase, partial [Actinobacteria bacterium]|nr:serine/threonine protein kinase [Actinomycetota bacterium]